MTRTTEKLIAVTPGGDITEEMLAGEYLWYSIPDAPQPLVAVRQAFEDNGLDPDRLPKVRRLEHVAQESCRHVERRESNGTIVEIRAEQVVHTAEEVVYQITRHVWDQEQRVIEHPKALRVTFNKKKGTLSFDRFERAHRAELASIEQEIRAYFDGHQERIPGRGIRTILRHYIEEVGAENMRGNAGAVYFMPKVNVQRDGTVIDGREFITRVLDTLTAIYERVDAHRVPCVNDEGQRAYLETKFVENCTEDIEAFRNRALELVNAKDKRARGYRRDVVRNMLEARDALTKRKDKWEQILGKEIRSLEQDMELADQALRKFMTAAEPEEVASSA